MATVDQFIAAYSSHSIYLERLAAGMGNTALPYIESINDRVMKLFNNLPKRRLSDEQQKAIRKEVNEIIKEELGEMVAEMKKSQKELGAYEAEWNDKVINAEIESNINTTIPSSAQITQAVLATPIKVGNGRFTTYGKMFSDYTKAQTERMDGIILNGFVNGQTNREIAVLIEQELPTWKGGAESQARTLARTGTNHYTTQARLQYEQENDKVIIGWRSIGTLDSRTSTQCFTGETEVTPACDIEKLYRAKYEGEIITINLSTGKKISGTPNHPVLTQHGWTPMGKINPSEHVIYCDISNVSKVLGVENVDVPTTFSELYESINVSTRDVLSKRASTTDFYGDGVGINGDIDVVETDSLLWDAFVSSSGESIKNRSLRVIHNAINFFGYNAVPNGIVIRPPIAKTSKWKAEPVNVCIKGCFFNSCFSDYVSRPHAIFKKINAFIYNSLRLCVNKPSSSWLPESELCEKASNSGGCSSILSGYSGSGRAVLVHPCNIVSVNSEFKSCHVYTLQSYQGYYIAGGAIVKNCRSLDGVVMKSNDPRFGKFKPPRHPNCRTSLAPEIDGRLKYDDSAAERPTNFTVDGKKDPKRVSSKRTYYEEMRKLSAADQDAILGPSLGKAFRKMDDPDKFARETINQATLQPLTLTEMKKKDNELAMILKAQERS